MIAGYFDDSGSHKGSKLFALCGFLADPRIWDDFSKEWNSVLDKPEWPNRPREFHTVELVHGDKSFEGWSFAERLALFGDMTSVILNTNLLALGSLFIVDAYGALPANYKQLLASGGLSAPEDFVFQYLLQVAITSTREYAKRHEPPIEEHLDLIFDEEPPKSAQRFHELYNHTAKKHPYGKMLLGISFRPSDVFTPLQAADLLAYTSYQWHLKELFAVDNDLRFPLSPGFQRMIQNIAARGGIYSHDALINLVAQEMINKANKGGV